MTSRRILYSIALLCSVLFLIFYIGYFSMFLLLFLLCLPLCSLLLMLPLHKKLSCSFTEQTISAACGEKAVFHFRLQNHSHLPVGQIVLQFSCHNLLTGEQFHKKLHFPATANGVLELPVVSPYCGRLELTVEKLTACDLFGLFNRKILLTQRQAFALILPQIPSLQIFTPPQTEMEGESAEYDTHHPGNDASEIFAVRDYQPGDRLNSIHWKLSEKRGSVMVRQGSLPLPAGPDILVELEKAPPKLLNCTAETALTLSAALLSAGQRHRLLWFGGNELHSIWVDSDDTAAEAEAVLLSAQPQEHTAALASYEQVAAHPLLYVTSGTVHSNLLPENAVVFSCNEAPEESSGNHFYFVQPGKIAETLDGLQL